MLLLWEEHRRTGVPESAWPDGFERQLAGESRVPIIVGGRLGIYQFLSQHG